ncbi:MAG: hypothetical protein JWN86_260 [Planctomycetota bacterium]|nr:hypothetical protein [Planctomycetota bacterium]
MYRTNRPRRPLALGLESLDDRVLPSSFVHSVRHHVVRHRAAMHATISQNFAPRATALMRGAGANVASSRGLPVAGPGINSSPGGSFNYGTITVGDGTPVLVLGGSSPGTVSPTTGSGSTPSNSAADSGAPVTVQSTPVVVSGPGINSSPGGSFNYGTFIAADGTPILVL